MCGFLCNWLTRYLPLNFSIVLQLIRVFHFVSSNCNCCVLHLRWPRWASRLAFAMCGSNWESKSTAATHGTPKPTATKRFLTPLAAASTGCTSAQLLRPACHAWPLITWPWWDWRSWTVDATPVITGESTVASLLGRKAQNENNLF